ncbi:MAG: N-acetylneuraminate synthase family protein, partial [Bacillota bacterium]|nr:N-acetylneuraminate synthase family protein [Bacillota bacterium]
TDLDEVALALKVLRDHGAGTITLLHCNTQYPTPFEDTNIKAMLTLKKQFGVEVGYSDHTLGIEAPIAAVALGATVIEKHFTLDKSMVGPDHKASLDPLELKAMVRSIRNIELALGDGIKRVSKSENPNKEIARKSIVARRDIAKGEIFTEENLTVKRPGNGISPLKWFEVLGKIAERNFFEDELIEL